MGYGRSGRLQNASVQQPLLYEPLPLPFCHPERSRGICSSADRSWKRGILSSNRIVYSPKVLVFFVKRLVICRLPSSLLEMSILFEHSISRFQEQSAELQIP